MNADTEQQIAAAAARQHGVITRRQLHEAGLSRCAIGRRLQSGRLRLLHRGVYLALPLSLSHTDDMAAVLASGPGAALSHTSAAPLLWQVRLATPTPVHVLVPRNCGQRPGIRAHRVQRIERDERTMREGIPVTTPARTLLDLSAMLPKRELEQAVARAERQGLAPEALARLLARYPGHRGAGRLQAVLDVEGGPTLTRSEAEAEMLALVREAGLPPPRCNVAMLGYELDFLWRDAGLAVEVDGFRYHSSRRSFEADHRRDAKLAAAGFTVVRFTWRQITEDRVATAGSLWQVLSRARR